MLKPVKLEPLDIKVTMFESFPLDDKMKEKYDIIKELHGGLKNNKSEWYKRKPGVKQ